MQVKERRFEWGVDEVRQVCAAWAKDAPLLDIRDPKNQAVYFIVLCSE